jgi:indolepyruvate ferredoxin oxidoreductase beta subunit
VKEFNIVITGIGGQGAITLANIITQSAFLQGFDVKMSELHGLAQRGGPIPCHVRFGKKIYSPLVMEGEAHLIIGLEPLEALRACYYGSKQHKTVFLIDNYPVNPLFVQIGESKYPSIKKIKNSLKKFSSRVVILDASETVRERLGSIVASNVYLLGYAFAKKFIPIKKKFLLEGIKSVVPERHFEMNKKAFELGGMR